VIATGFGGPRRRRHARTPGEPPRTPELEPPGDLLDVPSFLRET